MSATLAIRNARPDEYHALVAWLNEVFHPTIPEFFQTRFCHLFRGPELLGDQSWIIEENGRFLGHVGLYPLDLKTSIGTLPTAGIGCVAVDPSARGLGIMRTLLEEVHRVALESGYVIALLGGVRSLYRRFGYEVCGTYYHWMWDRQQRKGEPSWTLSCDHPEALYPLWCQKPYGVQWDFDRFKALLQRPMWDSWVRESGDPGHALVRNQSGEIVLDYYGGPSEVFPSLMDWLTEHYQAAIRVRHGEGEEVMHDWMVRSGMDVTRRSQGMIRILDPAALAGHCHRHGITAHGLPEALPEVLDPATLEQLCHATRRLFGDPFDRITDQPVIRWDWEIISRV